MGYTPFPSSHTQTHLPTTAATSICLFHGLISMSNRTMCCLDAGIEYPCVCKGNTDQSVIEVGDTGQNGHVTLQPMVVEM